MKANRFDIWFTKTGQVYKDVPFDVAAEWVQESRIHSRDKLKPAGSADWHPLSDFPLLSVYQGDETEPEKVDDIDSDTTMPMRRVMEEDDSDVDMIPLIDISLVLLIFFMMTTTVAAISKIQVPEMANATKIDSAPDVLRIDMDYVDGKIVYGVGAANLAHEEGEGNLAAPEEMFGVLENKLNQRTSTAKVRIAAHGDIPYEFVDTIMTELERRRERGGRIGVVTVQVNDKP